MAKEKEFKNNAAMELIAGAEAPEAPKKRRSTKKRMQEVPFGYMVAPEPKSERVNLLVKKTVRRLLQEDADALNVSVNEVVNRILDEYYGKTGRG